MAEKEAEIERLRKAGTSNLAFGLRACGHGLRAWGWGPLRSS